MVAINRMLMTKDEAKKALENGELVTHIFFGPAEFIRQNRAGQILSAIEQEHSRFWKNKQDKCWDDGWSVYQKPKDK